MNEGEKMKRAADDCDHDDGDDEEYRSCGERLALLAAGQDVEKVEQLLASSGVPASYQNEATGASALMIAASTGNLKMVSVLLANGSPWNALDRCGKCAGEYALDGSHQECVDALVSAGVAAELMFGAIDRGVKSKSLLVASPESSSSSSDAGYDAHFPAVPGQYLDDRGVRYDGENLLDSANDAVMMAWEAPLMEAHADALCNATTSFGDAIAELDVDPSTTVATYARASLQGGGGGEETALERAMRLGTANSSSSTSGCGGGGGRVVLNVGFGMGIVDSALQRRLTEPGDRHFIVEPHPAVLAKMTADGWFQTEAAELTAALDGDGEGGTEDAGSADADGSGGRGSGGSSAASTSLSEERKRFENVTVLRGTWQDALRGPCALLSEGVKFDSVFFDTYGERYSDMADFHALLPHILKPGGTYSFFNGMCPFNLFFHGVACELVKTELQSLGFRSAFVPLQVDIPDKETTWDGVVRKYWQRDTYYLPICVFLP